jgi:uncharacterized protein (TIGR03086 family)
MSTDGLERAHAITRGVLANVKADQLDDATPCKSWKVRNVITHIVGGNYWFAASMTAGASPDVDSTENTDYAAGDFVASYDDATQQAVAAFGAPGALQKMVTLPFGEMPGAAFLGLATTDVFVHGWDIAKATGQSTDLDAEMAAQLLEGARAAIPPGVRGPDPVAPFGPEVDAPASACAADRLAAFLGRTV